MLLGPPGTGLPWERPAELNPFSALLLTLRMILFSPLAAFHRMRRRGPWWSPALYTLMTSLLALVVFMLIGRLLRNNWQAERHFEPQKTAAAVFSAALLLPALAGLLTHLLLKLSGGRQPGLGLTLRVIYFALGSTAIFWFFPCCGNILFLIWYTVAASAGITIVHRLPARQVMASVLPPAVLLMVLIMSLIDFLQR
jgi:hypothetical protein